MSFAPAWGWLLRCDLAARTCDATLATGGFRDDSAGTVTLRAGDAGAEVTATWDGRTLELTRDPTGCTPLFHARAGGAVLASTDARALLAQPGVAREPDPVALAEWLLGSSPDPEQTLISALCRVPAGHLLTIDSNGERLTRTWTPPVPGSLGMADAERFGPTLEAAIARIAGTSRTAVYLSGGIDSAAVATAAGRPLALCVTFEGASEELTQLAVVEALGLERLSTTAAATPGVLERALDRAAQSLWPTPALWAPFYDDLANRAREHGAEVILDGLGGDELLDAGYAGGRALRRTPLAFARWLQAERRYTSTARASLRAAFAPSRAREAPGWLAPDPALRTAIEDRLEPSRRSYAESRRDDLLDPLNAAGREATWDDGIRARVRRRSPLWDVSVVELLDGLPPDALVAGGLPKSPAQAYLRTRIPAVPSPWPRPAVADALYSAVLGEESLAQAAKGFPNLETLGVLPRPIGHEGFRSAPLWAMLSLEHWLRQGTSGESP